MLQTSPKPVRSLSPLRSASHVPDDKAWRQMHSLAIRRKRKQLPLPIDRELLSVHFVHIEVNYAALY